MGINYTAGDRNADKFNVTPTNFQFGNWVQKNPGKALGAGIGIAALLSMLMRGGQQQQAGPTIINNVGMPGGQSITDKRLQLCHNFCNEHKCKSSVDLPLPEGVHDASTDGGSSNSIRSGFCQRSTTCFIRIPVKDVSTQTEDDCLSQYATQQPIQQMPLSLQQLTFRSTDSPTTSRTASLFRFATESVDL